MINMHLAARLVFQSLLIFILLWPERAAMAQSESLVWTSIGPGGDGIIECFAIDPFNANTLYAGAIVGGIFKSKNGGARWFGINAGMPPTSVVSIAINRSNNK